MLSREIGSMREREEGERERGREGGRRGGGGKRVTLYVSLSHTPESSWSAGYRSLGRMFGSCGQNDGVTWNLVSSYQFGIRGTL